MGLLAGLGEVGLNEYSVRKIFDSLRQVRLAGLRTATTHTDVTVRQLLYEATPYVLDIRLEQEARSSQVDLVGQILYGSGVGKPLKDLPVALKRGEEVLQQLTTSAFGEFQFTYQDLPDLVLTVNGPEGFLSIGLPEFEKPDARGKVIEFAPPKEPPREPA